jgi:hypothetical protein
MLAQTKRKGWPATRLLISVFTTPRRTWAPRPQRSSTFKIACETPQLGHNKTAAKIGLKVSY